MIGAIVGDIAGSGTGSFTANSVMFLAVGQSLMECGGKCKDLTARVKDNASRLMKSVYQEKASEMRFNRISCLMPLAYFARSYREIRQLTSLIMTVIPGSTLEDAYVAELEVAQVFKYLRFLSFKSYKKAFLPKRFIISRKTGEYIGEIDKAFRASRSFSEAITEAKATSDPCNMAAVAGALAEPYHGVPVSFRIMALEILGPELADLFERIETFAEPRVSTYVPDDVKPGIDHYDAGRFSLSYRKYLKRYLGNPKDFRMSDPICIESSRIDLSQLKQEEEND